MSKALHIATYNIHKGFSHFNRRMMLYELRDKLRELNADIIFLQEVHGSHLGHANRYSNWPNKPQYEFLADSVWNEFAYGKNAVYEEGDHGNAILSRFPITYWENQDISTHRFGSRGLLHCEVEIPDWPYPLHCINVHLGLLASERKGQIGAICERIQKLVPDGAPLIIAGDFNDWLSKADQIITKFLKVKEVFRATLGSFARSFPSPLPLLPLDRIYTRGFEVLETKIHRDHSWSKISDHVALSAHMSLI